MGLSNQEGKFEMTTQSAGAETPSTTYKGFQLAGVAALGVVVLTLGEIAAFIFYPQPGTVQDWFLLFQSNKLLGLIDFWLLEVVMYLLFVPVFFALYAVLRKINPSAMALVAILVLLGIAIFLATNNPFSMLSLSTRYAAATTDAQRSALVAAGETLLANTGQRAVGGFNMGLFLVSVAGLIVSIVMRKGGPFSRATAVVGILAYGLSLADYLRQALTSSPLIALAVILPGALLLSAWYVMVGRGLWRMGRAIDR